MAARLDAVVTLLERLLNPEQSAIELYRADFATPETLEAMRFWAQGEYNRIQNGFGSTDDAVKLLAGALSELVDAIDEIVETGGLQGEKGDKGDTGPAGESVAVYEQSTAPTEAKLGDIWIKT